MRKAWTDEERNYVLANYKHMTYDAMGKHLGRSGPQVSSYLNITLGLRRGEFYRADQKARMVNGKTEHHEIKVLGNDWKPSRMEAWIDDHTRKYVDYIKGVRGTYREPVEANNGLL